jgi:hypothetical protein
MKSTKTTVTLEDLLRVKRAESPPAEFWNEFERELRAKQLAAIVEPRPWWAPFIRVSARFSNLQIPIGAAAILAVTFVSVRQYDAVLSPSVVPNMAMQQQADEVSPRLAISSVNTSVTDVAEQQGEPIDYAEAVALDIDESVTSSSMEMTSAPSQTPSAPVVQLEPTPSARYIAANLAAAQEADPSLMDEVFGDSLRHAQTRQPMRDPLAHVSSPGESRRARLLATALPVSAGSNEIGNAPNDRIARRLTEERLYDTITRVGLKGDRVAIKF